MISKFLKRNKTLICDKTDYSPFAQKNMVNLNWWHIEYGKKEQNLGDMLSEIICNYMCNYYAIDFNKQTKKTKHMYCIGSIMFFGYQDATVWGTGALNELSNTLKNCIKEKLLRHLDIRAVRGPLTRNVLLKLGLNCPDIYGDPAILLPLFYKPKIESSSNKILVIPHFEENIKLDNNEDFEIFNMKTDDWKKSIDKIASAKCVISSSLHGIIIAESYGIPAIFLCNDMKKEIFKFKDYYFSTGREDFPIIKSIEEGCNYDFSTFKKIDFSSMQKNLINTFPVDLWK